MAYVRRVVSKCVLSLCDALPMSFDVDYVVFGSLGFHVLHRL